MLQRLNNRFAVSVEAQWARDVMVSVNSTEFLLENPFVTWGAEALVRRIHKGAGLQLPPVRAGQRVVDVALRGGGD